MLDDNLYRSIHSDIQKLVWIENRPEKKIPRKSTKRYIKYSVNKMIDKYLM